MNFKVHLLLMLLISTSVYCQHNYSKKQIDSVLQSINIHATENPKLCVSKAQELYKISTLKKYEIGQSLALIRIAQSEGNLDNFKKAFDYAEKAKKTAIKIKNDSLQLFSDFTIAVQFGRSGFNDKALAILDDCFKRVYCLRPNSKNSYLSSLYTYKAYFSAGLKNPPDYSVLIEYHKKAAYYHKLSKRKLPNSSYTNIGLYYDLIGQIDSGIYYYKKAIEDYNKFNNRTAEVEYTNLAEIYFKNNNFDLALKYLDSSTVIAKEKRIYYLLADNYTTYKKIYLKINDKEKILKYQDLELIYKDSTYESEKRSVNDASNYLVTKSEAEIKAHENKTRWIFFIVMIGFVFACYFIRQQYVKRVKIKKESVKKDSEIQVKTNEIVNLKQKVTTSYEEVIQLAKKDDPLFVNFFKELYPEFYNKLMKVQPDLTITEQKVCFFLKLKFSTKEIADYTFVTTKAIQNRKNRLRKRLYMNEGDDLYLWIDNL